jgi:cyclophilin family peptidyl-prolyl cis-trans isomerase
MTTYYRPAQSDPSYNPLSFIVISLIILLVWNQSGRATDSNLSNTGVPDSLADAKLYSVESVPTAIRTKLKLTPFYHKYLNVRGLPIVASSKVSDYALREAAWILRNMMSSRNDILQAMGKKQVFIVIMAYNEYTTDIPEHSRLKPRIYWDRRARGLGGNPVSCGEENLLCYPRDPYEKENILIHEFAHCIHSRGLREVDPAFEKKLKTAYERARQKGLWENTYAITNRAEYWAEAVQCWFDDNRENDALHNHVNTRAELKTYDPDLARLCTDVLGDGPWRYKKPLQRNAGKRAHLTGFDFSQTPTFKWRKESLTEKPRVSIQTAIGDIELELDAKNAPISTRNFIRYVHEGFYSDGMFFRTVRPGNQPDNPIKIAVIQAQANPSREAESFDPIPLERTRDTHLRHLDGALSMARMGPDTATHHFFICIGEQPELDFGGKRNPDGQGFAVFGRVVKGMEVARKIHQLPAQGQTLNPPVLIQRAIRRH